MYLNLITLRKGLGEKSKKWGKIRNELILRNKDGRCLRGNKDNCVEDEEGEA